MRKQLATERFQSWIAWNPSREKKLGGFLILSTKLLYNFISLKNVSSTTYNFLKTHARVQEESATYCPTILLKAICTWLGLFSGIIIFFSDTFW